jgi:hypothetical protein
MSGHYAKSVERKKHKDFYLIEKISNDLIQLKQGDCKFVIYGPKGYNRTSTSVNSLRTFIFFSIKYYSTLYA